MAVLKKNLSSDLGLLMVAMVWGSGFIGTQMTLDYGLSSGLILLLRFSIAAIILFVAFIAQLRSLSRVDLLYGGIAGLLLFTAFYSQTVGLSHTTPSNNALLTGANVIMVPFISWALFKSRPPAKAFLSAALCLLGIGILSYSPGEGFAFNLGDSLTLVSAFLFACHISFLGVCAQKVSTKKLIFLQMAVSAVLSAPVFLLFEMGTFTTHGLVSSLPAVAYLGVFSTCFAFFVQTWAQKKTSPTKASIILATESLFGSLFSVILGYDKPTLSLLLGGSIIITSIFTMETKK